MTDRELSFGEKAVGLTFNPSGDPLVTDLKTNYAVVINLLNDLRNATEDPEKKRLCSVAITEAQAAQMWAVKAATWDSQPTPETENHETIATGAEGETAQDFQDRAKQADEDGNVPTAPEVPAA